MKQNFPWISLGSGLVFSFLLLRFGPQATGNMQMPLLTALFMCEVGLVVTAIGAGMAYMKLRKGWHMRAAALLTGNALLAAMFLYLGITYWPQGGF